MAAAVMIDDELFEQAVELAGPNISRTEIVREAIKAFVRVHVAKRLARLGGMMPGTPDIPRRRPASE